MTKLQIKKKKILEYHKRNIKITRYKKIVVKYEFLIFNR
jgi:hypothetical protein